MIQRTRSPRPAVIGIDLGDRTSEACALDEHGEILFRKSIATTREGLAASFGELPSCLLVFEASTSSPWIDRFLRELGHRTHVADPRRVPLLKSRKTDVMDAEVIARMARADLRLLGCVRHRPKRAQQVSSVMRARQTLVRSRTAIINSARGLMKSNGYRLPSGSAGAAHKHIPSIPEELRWAIVPMLESCGKLTATINEMERQLEKIAIEEYPETEILRQIPGVGLLTSLAFVLTIDDPKRFRRARDVGAYLGLTPRLHESGTMKPQLGISKCGDETLRTLLVSAAQCILRSSSPSTDLKEWGLRLHERGGGNAKKRAVVAVARKLAVLMLAMLKNREAYDPYRQGLAERPVELETESSDCLAS